MYLQNKGAVAELARKVGVSRAAVHQWRTGATQVAPTRVIEVERATGISRHDLRSDLYPRDSQ